MTGLLNQNRRKFIPFFQPFVVVYVGHGIVHQVALLHFPTSIFAVKGYRDPEVKSSVEKKQLAPLYGSMRLE